MTITQSSTRFVAVAAGIVLALSLLLAPGISSAQAALSEAQIQSILGLLSSFGADAATINNVNAALRGQATPGTGGNTGGSGACPALSRDLQQGSTGADVKALQVFLNGSASTQVAASGAGSPGNETTTFGPATKAAVIKFQTSKGVTPAAGYVGAKTRAAIAASCGGPVTPGPGPGPAGTVTVTAGAQPANSIAPEGANRVPFTTFTLTNNSGSSVTINSVTVQRTGLAQDAAFSGVVLLDSNGIQIGNTKTFNSNHQANLGDTGFTLAAGASMNFTVAGNMSSSLDSYSGQIASLQVVAVNTSAAVSGSLPITGASQQLNSTLAIGSFSTTTSSVVPPTTTTKTQNVGDTGVRFSGLKFTASSAEDLKLYSIRWRQVGSASSADISNVVTVANGTTYPTTLDSTGKYYTTIFPGGILIPKGNNLDVYVQADITGSNSASRNVKFDIDRATDVYFVGQLYGYGIAAPSSGLTAQPWYAGDQFNIQAGTASTISKSTESADAAQSIAINIPNQPLGGFVTNFLGEPVTVSSMSFQVASSSGSAGDNLTSVSIVDENGAVIAGPIDEADVASDSDGTGNLALVFSDSVTFPVGKHTYHIRGKVASGTTNGATIQLTVIPSNWGNPTGQVTGSTVSLSSNSFFSLNTMTVRGATTTLTMSSTPAAQNVVAGVQSYTFANVQIDASQSGEDIRLSSLPLTYAGTASILSSCQLYDGSTALTTGSRIQNSISAGTITFTFDNSLVIPKGTVKTVSVVCNLSSSASNGNTANWTLLGGSNYSASGVSSGSSITPTVASLGASGTQTVASGSLTVTAASSATAQPALARVPAGSTGVTMGNIKLRATNEALTLTKLGLTLDGSNDVIGSLNRGATGNTGHTAKDNVIRAYLYQGATLVGVATFTGTTATTTGPNGGDMNITLTKDTDTILTIKADLAGIGTSEVGGIGDTVTIDPLNAEATGQSSGTTVQTGATAGVNGVMISKTVPTVALASGACSGTGCNGANQILKAFTVTANAAGQVSIYQFKTSLATSSANVTAVSVQVYDEVGNVATSTFGTQQCTSGCSSSNPTLTFTGGPVLIPAGKTYTFKVIGTVTPASSATQWSVITTLLGTSTDTGGMGSSPTYIATTTTVLSGGATFIWSDNATTTAGLNDVDWFSGYQVSGLPSIGI